MVLVDAREMPSDLPPVQRDESKNPCADLWERTRSEARANGARDGDARRQADVARAACESERSVTPTPTSFAPSPCLGDQLGRQAPAADSDAVYVYFPCGDAEPSAAGLRAFERSLEPGLTVEQKATTLVSWLLGGPGETERARGYLAPDPVAAEHIASVEWSGGALRIDLAPGIEQTAPWSSATFSTGFLAAMEQTLFQLDEVTTVELSIGGECRRFSELVEFGPECVVSTRESTG